MPDLYLKTLLAEERVAADDVPVASIVRALASTLAPWTADPELPVTGALARGTLNRSGLRVDVLLPLAVRPAVPIERLQHAIGAALQHAGFAPEPRILGLGAWVEEYAVDLIPIRYRPTDSPGHDVVVGRTGTWLRTDLDRHLTRMRAAKRQDEVRLLKLWSHRCKLRLPSFACELIVQDALRVSADFSVSSRMTTVLGYLRDRMAALVLVDPANTENDILSDMPGDVRLRIAGAADRALRASRWAEVFEP